jgi:hypothetical protein
VGKCSFIIFKNTLVDSSLLNYTEGNMNWKLIPEDVQPTLWVCGHLLASTTCSSPTRGMGVYLLWVLSVIR